MLHTAVATTGRAQPGVSYGRYRGVLTDTGTACNHHEDHVADRAPYHPVWGSYPRPSALPAGTEGHHRAGRPIDHLRPPETDLLENRLVRCSQGPYGHLGLYGGAGGHGGRRRRCRSIG